MRNLAAVFVAGMVALCSACAHGENGWPQFRGPDGAGVGEGLNPPLGFGPDSNLLWKVEVGKGHSSPIVQGGSVFVTGCDGLRLETVCLELNSGKTRWRQGIDVPVLEKAHEANSPASPTPVCDAERVYAYFASFGLVAYDFNGREVWRKPLPMPEAFRGQGTGTSPLRVGDAVVVFQQKGDQSALMAFGAKDGKEMWKAPCPLYNMTWSTPLRWREAAGERVGLACAGRFSAFDSDTGKLIWWTDGLSQQVCSTPVCLDGTLFISSASVQGERGNMTVPPPFEEFVKAYDRNGDGLIAYDEVPPDYLFTDRHASGGEGNMTLRLAMKFFGGGEESKPLDKQAWEKLRDSLRKFMESKWNNSNIMAVRAGGEGDVTTSNRIWQQTRGVPEISSALIYDKRIYQVRNGGLVVCRRQDTGELIYEERLVAQGGYFASPIAADGRIYMVSDQGVVTVIGAGDSFSELARNEIGESIKATPALAKGTIIIRSAGHLWAFAQK